MHAKLLEHSLLLLHSGLQFGGDPMYSGRQEQDGESFMTWQIAPEPHGDGWHGFVVGGGGSSTAIQCVSLYNDVVVRI